MMALLVTVAALRSAIVAAQLLTVAPSSNDVAVERAVSALKTVRANVSIPPTVVVDGRSGPDIRTRAVTFRLRDKGSGELDPYVYVNRASRAYQLAFERNAVGIVMLAASLAHEIGHGNGAGEAGAYATEADFMRVYLATQPLNSSDREILEYNLVNVQNLQRIEAEVERRLTQARKRKQ